MSTGRSDPPAARRLVPSRVSADSGAWLVETPLRPHNWIGFVLSWILLGAGITLMVVGTWRMRGVGGMCASGGPYAVAVPCPDGVVALMAGGMGAVAVAVLVGVFAARGLGPPVHGWFWSVLFGAQGTVFLVASTAGGRVSWGWLVCGIVFVLAALPPAWLVPVGWPRSVFGRRRLDGRSLATHGLPVGDAIVLGVCWLAAVGSGVAAVVLLK